LSHISRLLCPCYFEDGSLKLFALSGLKLWSSRSQPPR
jgi:hypothetical protein